MSTPKKAAIKSPNLWTGIATIVSAGFAYFSLTPDLSTAQILADEANRAAEAISTRNYVVLFTVVVNAGNILYHLFKKN